VIVSDASPLIVLLKTKKLSILKKLFEKIVVPTAVYREITAKEQEKVGPEEMKELKTLRKEALSGECVSFADVFRKQGAKS
jgi:predicted nucleic acid-binding protein